MLILWEEVIENSQPCISSFFSFLPGVSIQRRKTSSAALKDVFLLLA
jgi:hypothetical protein